MFYLKNKKTMKKSIVLKIKEIDFLKKNWVNLFVIQGNIIIPSL